MFMGPSSRLQTRGGPFFFFTTQCPSAHKRVAQCCSLGASFPFPFFLFFHLLTVPFSLMYMTSSCSPFCHASPLPRVVPVASPLHHTSPPLSCAVSPSLHMSTPLHASPLVTGCPCCVVSYLIMCCPSSHVASQLCCHVPCCIVLTLVAPPCRLAPGCACR